MKADVAGRQAWGEVIGERVRDKIAASKRKGIWVGGPVPLGYRCINRKLVVVPEESETVRTIFRRYLDLGSMGALIEDLDRRGIRTKAVARLSGRVRGGIRFGVGPLAHLLKNRFYLGEVVYRGEVHAGEHEPIVDRGLFAAVQAKLAANAVARKVRLRGSAGILTGRIYDDRRNHMSPIHSNKLGVRYRYCVSHALLQNRKEEVLALWDAVYLQAGSDADDTAAEQDHHVVQWRSSLRVAGGEQTLELKPFAGVTSIVKKFKWRYLLVLPVVFFAFVFVSRARSDARFKSGPIGQLKQAAGDVHYAKLVPAGERLEGGLYDPSAAYTPDGGVGWLAYSSVKGDYKPIGPYVHTHLARTTNGGARWEFVKVLNTSADATLTTDEGKQLSGAWRYEVPTLVFDSTDPDTTRRWKLFVHRYFWNAKHDRMVKFGWIALRTAVDPAGEWSEEVPLFGAGNSPAAPWNKTRVDLNTLDPSLKNAAAYSEPGALTNDGRLYLSMSALLPRLGLTGINVGHTIILLASDDHGATWRFVRKLLDDTDASRLGCELFDGTSLAREDGRFFLLASPGHRGAMHDGTAAFEFESLAEGRLRLGTNGLPAVAAYFAPQPGIFSGPGAGQATYDSGNTNGGLIMPQFNLRAYPEVFQIYQTGRRIVPKE